MNLYKKRRIESDNGSDAPIYDGFMDDDSEPHKFGTAVLPVANLPASFNDVPKDGMEYLFTVRREERRLPLVTRVHNPYSVKETVTSEESWGQDDTAVGKAQSLLPTEEWRECFEERFRNFRTNIQQPTIHISLPHFVTSASRIPEMRERDRWWAFFRGDRYWGNIPTSQFHSKKRKQTVDYDEEMPQNKEKMRGWVVYDEQLSWEQGNDDAVDDVPPRKEDVENPENVGQLDSTAPCDGNRNEEVPPPSTGGRSGSRLPSRTDQEMSINSREPTPELLNLLDQKITFHLLKYFIRWIQGHFDDSCIPPPPPLHEVNSGTKGQDKQDYDLTPTHARWIFALLCRLDAQLSSEEISVLRQLAREVIRVLKEETPSRDFPHKTKPSMGATACWMIVAAIAGIWGQRDLWMDAEQALR